MMKKSEDFEVGQRVTANSEEFLQPLRKKLKNRAGVVQKITPSVRPHKNYCGMLNRVAVLWLKKNGRGEEFIEWMPPSCLNKVEDV